MTDFLKETNVDAIFAQVAELKKATERIPDLIKRIDALPPPEELSKAWKEVSKSPAKRGTKSILSDPLSLAFSMGYKDRRFSLSFDILRRIVNQLGILSSIINTRVTQIASFAQPYRITKSLGFIIRHKDSERKTTKSEQKFIKELEQFVGNCGRSDPNPYNRHTRDTFETYLRKTVRDSLELDQTTTEVVSDKSGKPYEFIAVDASTIRIAEENNYGVNMMNSYHHRQTYMPASNFTGMQHIGAQYGRNVKQKKAVRYLQLINNSITNSYTDDELIFAIRNPRTDYRTDGYGLSEIEQIINIITGMLWAEEFNRRIFSNKMNINGMINFKGDFFSPDQLEAFRRQFQANALGVENVGRTPIIQSEGVEFIDFSRSNQDMQFNAWLEYLTRICCGVFLIDPSEIGFDLSKGAQQAPLFESSSESKIKMSRDKGLKPLLRFFAGIINKNIIDKIDDHFMLEFAGLDELTEQEKHELAKEQLQSYKTLNEIRAGLDLSPLPGGDYVMNPIYLQALGMEQQKQQGGEQEGIRTPPKTPEPTSTSYVPGQGKEATEEAKPTESAEEQKTEAGSGEGRKKPEKEEIAKIPKFLDNVVRSLSKGL